MKGILKFTLDGFFFYQKKKRKKTHLEFHRKVVLSRLLELAVMEKLLWCRQVAVSVSATAS